MFCDMCMKSGSFSKLEVAAKAKAEQTDMFRTNLFIQI